MDRKSLIEALKGNGYTGSDTDPAAVKSWMASQGIDTNEVDAPDGTKLKFDDVWAKAPTMKLRAPSATPVGNPADPGRGPEVMVKGRWREKAKKAYDIKAQLGKTAYADSDEAEFATAQIRLVTAGQKHYDQKRADMEIVQKAMAGVHNYTGGALIPESYVAQLIYLTETYGVARKVANVVTMTRDIQRQPRKTGIVTMAHRAATGSFALSDNAYDTVNLTAKDVGCLVKVNINLFDDAAINVADDINSSVAEAQLIREDSDYVLGDGTATYGNQLGLANALPSGAYIDASGNAWSAIVSGDIAKIIGSVENVNPARLAFMGTRQWYAQVGIRMNIELQRFKEIIGPSTGGGDASLLGYPFYFTQVMPTASASASKCLYFGDFMGGSMLGVRKDVQIATSDSFYFDTGDIAIRAHARMNVNIHGDGRGSTYGPIVCLKTT